MNKSPGAASLETSSGNAPLSRGAWLALIAALLGWMFDGAEMGVFSLVGRPALQDLLPPSPEREQQVATWLGVITGLFLVGAATGGVLFGWLGDRIGRVRAMTISVLTYALFTSLCGAVNSPYQLGIMRFIASLGMGGEWSLGVALVMEVFPGRSRAFMAGLIGAAANVGYLMVGIVGLGITSVRSSLEALVSGLGLPPWLAERLVANDCWRVMMILGIVPALLTFFIRIFVPESEKWEQEKEKGSTSNWATQDLFGVLLGAFGPALMVYLYAYPATTVGGEVLFQHSTPLRLVAIVFGLALAIVGYTYPVVRFLQRYRTSGIAGATDIFGSTLRRMALAACLSGVALLGTWGATQQAPSWADKIADSETKAAREKLELAGEVDAAKAIAKPKAKEYMLIWLSVGAIVGTLAAAYLGDLLGRRNAYFTLCVLAFGSVILLFQTNTHYGSWMFVSAFIAGTCSASFYGWLPLYLPELFPTSVRATGQGFGFNFGRILAAIGSFQLGGLVAHFSEGLQLGPWKLAGGYATACTLLSLVYGVGMIIIWFAPETKGKPLPE
jgi:SHS family sialic acid transporter-like MFS transporter